MVGPAANNSMLSLDLERGRNKEMLTLPFDRDADRTTGCHAPFPRCGGTFCSCQFSGARQSSPEGLVKDLGFRLLQLRV
jgi:hypothetical protein